MVLPHHGGSDVHSCTEVVGSFRRPLRRNDAVKGMLYACEWLGDDFDERDGVGTVVTSRTRALWVPEAGLLFQWRLPRGTVQVVETKKFPPPENEARAAFLEDCTVPYTVIREARKYLERQGHIHAKEAVIQKAMDRITDEATRSEGRLQSALAKAGLRP